MTYSDETITYAMQKGVDPADLPLICNGCSGGLSWIYALGGRAISCVECCNRHDIDYELGGTAADRLAADVRLRECTLGMAGGNAFKRARAWVMYAGVRAFGRFFWARNSPSSAANKNPH